MNQISADIRGAFNAYVILLSKGLLDDDRWDWDLERTDWEKYQACFGHPSMLRTAICIFVNNLKVNENGHVLNYLDARFRGFQYFRSCVEESYELTQELEAWEYEEQDWLQWEC